MASGITTATYASTGAAGVTMRKPWFVLLATLVVALALALRLLYVFGAKVENPIAGDVNQYVLYAWNMIHAHTFSSTLPNSGPIIADAYRGPGYPTLIAGTMLASGNSELGLIDAGNGRMALVAIDPSWITGVCVLQAILGALTALLTIAIARFWLGRGAALGAGLLVALWPHMISFSGVMLTETAFGFFIALALWLLLFMQRRGSGWLAACGGLAFAASYLINPVIGVFPLLAAALLVWVRVPRRVAVIFLACFLLAPIGWSLRNATLPQGSGSYDRAVENFVQGSWPDFLPAFNSRRNSPDAAALVAAEQAEEAAFKASTRQGLRLVGERMAVAPSAYVKWYLIEKPFLLWDWGIRIGWGDIYVLATPESPFTRIPALRAMVALFSAANPVIFVLAALACIALALRLLGRRRDDDFAAGSIALLALYLTAVHVVLQAEPRYSVPYRSEEMLLAVAAIAWMVRRVDAWRRRHGFVAPAIAEGGGNA